MKQHIFTGILILIFFLGLNNSSVAQSLSRLPNPERGLRFEAMAKVPGLGFPWDPARKLNTQTWCKDLEAGMGAADGHVRVSQLYIYLTEFANVDSLSREALDTITSIFNGVRKQGYKLVLRFAYTYDGTGGYVYPPMIRILKHLEQLRPIIRNNIDVIEVWQAGIIGLWGEWHNYNGTYSQADKDTLIRKILDILPQGRQTQLRLPGYKNAASLSDNEKKRVGFNNDFFTDDRHPHAESDGFLYPGNYTQVKTESPDVFVEGEMPYEGDPAASSYYLNYVLDPVKTIKQLKEHNYTSLSLAHNYSVTFAGWKTMTITQAQADANQIPYDPEYFISGPRTVYNYVNDYLGYRLYVDHANSYVTDAGSQVNCNINLTNYGFSALKNPRQVYLVLTTATDSLVDMVEVNTDPAKWYSGVANRLTGTLNKLSSMSNYKVGIWMPDFEGSAGKYDPRYAIRLCNANTVWTELNYQGNQKIGMNSLNLNACNTTNPPLTNGYCRAGGGINGRDRFIQTIKTTGALLNIDYTGTGYPLGGYNNYINQKITIAAGGNFNLNIMNSPATKRSRVAAWVDWNRDSIFEPSTEQVFDIGVGTNNDSSVVLNLNRNIAVPFNVSLGQAKMRIRLYSALNANPGPCGIGDTTTTQDLLLNIISPYCVAGSNNTAERYIMSFSTTGAIHNISYSNNSNPANGYQYFVADSVVVNRNASIRLNLTNSINTKWSRVRIYADWNGNGKFTDAGETIVAIGNAGQDNSAAVLNISANITIPASAILGKTRLRVRFYDAWNTDPGPCDITNLTTTQDFNLIVVPTIINYCAASGGTNATDRYITSFNTTNATRNINYTNNTYPANGYGFYTTDYIVASPGNVFNLNIKNSPNTKWSRVKVYADWNLDGDFNDSGETLFAVGNGNPDSSAIVLNINRPITVPANANIGSTRIRVRFSDAWIPDPGPCGQTDRTTTQDYIIDVTLPVNQQLIRQDNRNILPDRMNEVDTNDLIMSISPNPAKEQFTIFCQSAIATNGYLSVSDASGKLMLTRSIVINSGKTKVKMNTEKLLAGIYFVKIVIGDNTYSEKIIIR